MTYRYVVDLYQPTFEFIRTQEFMAIKTQDGDVVAVTGPSTHREAALNARLFSAAPAMLFALKAFCERLESDGRDGVDDLLREARGLIEEIESSAQQVPVSETRRDSDV